MIEAFLVGNQPTQLITVRWAATPDQPAPTGGPDAASVHLWIITGTADSVAVVATDTSGTYTAALTARPGNTYRLAGRILGTVVAGATTVPAALQVASPANGDTLPSRFIAVIEGNPAFAFTAQLSVIATGGAGFLLQWTLDGAAPGSAGGGSIFATTVPSVANISFLGSIPIHAHLVVRYLDAQAAAYDNPAIAASALTGAPGVFGSELRDSVSAFVVP